MLAFFLCLFMNMLLVRSMYFSFFYVNECFYQECVEAHSMRSFCSSCNFTNSIIAILLLNCFYFLLLRSSRLGITNKMFPLKCPPKNGLRHGKCVKFVERKKSIKLNCTHLRVYLMDFSGDVLEHFILAQI